MEGWEEVWWQLWMQRCSFAGLMTAFVFLTERKVESKLYRWLSAQDQSAVATRGPDIEATHTSGILADGGTPQRLSMERSSTKRRW